MQTTLKHLVYWNTLDWCSTSHYSSKKTEHDMESLWRSLSLNLEYFSVETHIHPKQLIKHHNEIRPQVPSQGGSKQWARLKRNEVWWHSV